jgi:XTP/dITP diphosphohydrolase
VLGPLLVATTNRGKLAEIRDILSDLPIELLSLDRIAPVAEPEETGLTFAANARLKALAYAAPTGLLTVAEDSGLEIDGLDGAPGVQSARYGGPSAPSYADKFALIYQGLRARGLDTSPARFVCALALAQGPRILFETRGTVEGVITHPPRGDGGFGYDPIFLYPPLGRTLAEIPREGKAGISHRGQAFRRLHDYLGSANPLRSTGPTRP